eukprot:gene8817-biopygen18158
MTSQRSTSACTRRREGAHFPPRRTLLAWLRSTTGGGVPLALDLYRTACIVHAARPCWDEREEVSPCSHHHTISMLWCNLTVRHVVHAGGGGDRSLGGECGPGPSVQAHQTELDRCLCAGRSSPADSSSIAVGLHVAACSRMWAQVRHSLLADVDAGAAQHARGCGRRCGAACSRMWAQEWRSMLADLSWSGRSMAVGGGRSLQTHTCWGGGRPAAVSLTSAGGAGGPWP